MILQGLLHSTQRSFGTNYFKNLNSFLDIPIFFTVHLPTKSHPKVSALNVSTTDDRGGHLWPNDVALRAVRQ